MKKTLTILVSALMVLSLASCAPSEEKIKAAIADGTVTIEDAKAKGWIDDAWVDANIQSVAASTKIHTVEPFTTTYLDGSPASSELISGSMCLVFFDTAKPETMEKLKVVQEVSPDLEKIGVPVLGILTDSDPEAAKEALAEMPFPILVYNDEMQTALKDYEEMFEIGFTSVFTKDGGFYSAWSTQPTADDLRSLAQSLADEG